MAFYLATTMETHYTWLGIEMQADKTFRVLVCGTNYGRFYLSAIRMPESEFELAGILARGSSRSEIVAKSLDVPLFRHVAELPREIDMACVAIGSAGSQVVLDLLRSGIHVLDEHPQRSEHLRVLLALAAEHEVCFHLNGHFGDLPAPKSFIAHLRNLQLEPRFLSLMTTDRSLYGILDILRRALSTLVPFEFSRSRKAGTFVLITGKIADIPTTLQVQDTGQTGTGPLEEGSHEYMVDFRITAALPEGVLSLLSLNGPVVWNRNYNQAAGDEPLWKSIDGSPGLSAAELWRERILANLRAIEMLAQDIEGNPPPEQQQNTHILEVAEAWEALGKQLADG